jgi:hypothetical protein
MSNVLNKAYQRLTKANKGILVFVKRELLILRFALQKIRAILFLSLKLEP